MKFKNFDIADVIGCNDVEQAKAYTGKKGYYADHLEQLDDFIETNRRIGTLYSIADKADTFERLIVGCEFDYHCPWTYFLPLDKVKKTVSAEKESSLNDVHNVKLTNLEIFVLEFILEDFDVELELSYKDGKKISLPNVISGFVQKLKAAENE